MLGVCVCFSVCVCVCLVGREDSLVIQLLTTDRSNRSPVTEFSGRLEGIIVRTPGHRGRLTLDNRPESAVCVSGRGRCL